MIYTCRRTYLIEKLLLSDKSQFIQNDPVVRLIVNSMEVTEVYQSSSTDYGEISTMVEGENSEEATTKAFILNVFVDPPPNFESDLRFSTIDYVVFAIMLAMSGEMRVVVR